MDLLCLDIENLQDSDKIAAVKHIEESLHVVKLGSSLAFQPQSPAKREKVDEAQSIVTKTKAVAKERKFQNLYNGLVPTCDKCRDTFPTLATLDTHMKRNHQPSNVSTRVENQKTEIKKETRKSPESKNDHSSKSTQPVNERYQCDFCDKNFGKRDSLLQHKICHTGKYECERCKHGFSEQRKLSKHLMKKENCQKFLGKNEEMVDMSSVKTEKVIEKKIIKETEGFKCVPCDVAFSKQYNLSRHQRRKSHKLETNISVTSLIGA